MSKEMTFDTEQVDTITARIYIAGDIGRITQECADYCDEVGLCVNIVESLYVYSFGRESGATITIINYPRFPDSYENIFSKAKCLGLKLMKNCNQRTFTISLEDKTFMFKRT